MNFNLQGALTTALLESLFMVGNSLIVSILLGGVIGLLLYVTTSKLFFRNKIVNEICGIIVNILRSIPFIILLVTLMPITKMIVGTNIGPKAVVVPLTVTAIAFYARLSQAAFAEVDNGVLEAASACGAHPIKIIFGILLPEARVGLINGITVTTISLIGYSAMAGTVGGGGIGDLAVRYGYQRYETDVMLLCVLILVIIVQGIQLFGDTIAKKANKRSGG
ncbi:methionine ABC transporter permease [Anaerotignum propionicum]|jgi:D-methionine transport system permease protein|uniref:D-methionine transport system permease protein n=1 Tax=Anaerotignum propionicum DSM 1682 TaxID=991789 RepID=A0A0X1U6R4_ANAPI|nr:methionine ABC transporter permease [Anaerotignum propionicum]AMJ40619.1 methionine import system permease protein MetP [Anaerotignum propionicum DSM 1682]MEA5057992.1 methionine ABC transporter permease [Anaerotignum propionicum]SHE91674.1 D-methionine transport system permease protein [[Clostridium] propionicum DSM 1682] [Anaerotignum propionicum DSM 1682]